MNKILCPIDFSKASLNALEFAVAIGEKNHSEIILLNIFTEADFNLILDHEGVDSEYKELLQQAERRLESIRDEINKISQPRGLKECTYLLKPGKVVDVLSDCAQEGKVDLIVIGTTGASGFDKRYIGSKAVSIVEHARCNVLCVPENRDYQGINSFVYATDYQEEDKISIQLLVLMANQMNASIDILHISHHNDTIDKAIYEDYIHEMKAFISYDKLSFNRKVYHHISEGLDDYMKTSESDLLILLYKKRNYFENLFHHSLTKHLSNFADFPFMVMKL